MRSPMPVLSTTMATTMMINTAPTAPPVSCRYVNRPRTAFNASQAGKYRP